MYDFGLLALSSGLRFHPGRNASRKVPRLFHGWVFVVSGEPIGAVGGTVWFLKKNLNALRPSEHPPVWGEKCRNV